MQVTVVLSLFGLLASGWVAVTRPSFLCLVSSTAAASLGPSPRPLLDPSICLLTSSILSDSFQSQVSPHVLGAPPLPEALGVPSVLAGGVGLLPRGGARTDQRSTGSPASIPGAPGLGLAGCCVTNPPPIQLPNLISHINKGLNWLHF